MTLPILGSGYAPGIHDGRWLAEPSPAVFPHPPTDLVELYGLDRLSPDRRLVCRWSREPDGILTCYWEPDIVPTPPR